uniref:Uncharacterized protein n=1 Tax=viral metagenome TaxID=1070528 RepID=A0A6M3JQ36_9ZZZZ
MLDVARQICILLWTYWPTSDVTVDTGDAAKGNRFNASIILPSKTNINWEYRKPTSDIVDKPTISFLRFDNIPVNERPLMKSVNPDFTVSDPIEIWVTVPISTGKSDAYIIDLRTAITEQIREILQSHATDCQGVNFASVGRWWHSGFTDNKSQSLRSRCRIETEYEY